MGVKNFLRIWLSPYAWVLGVRHFLYDTGIIPSREFPQVPIICVGNLAAGGTGKTPMTEYLVELLLQNGKRPMVLSRGYGRKTKGFHYVEPHGEAGAHLLWGDEPLQIKYRFPGVVVAVCEDRVAGVERLLADYPEDPWILLDDAMQHRRLKPSKTILMSNYNRPYWKDRLLPFGRLRDLPSAARRADCLVLTHCPSPLTPPPSLLTLHPSPLAPHPTFHTYMSYGQPFRLGAEASACMLREDSSVLLVTGIANAQPLRDYVQLHYTLERHLNYPDHHVFSGRDLEKIKLLLQKNPSWQLVTTAKDAVRLMHSNIPGWVIPIEVRFFSEESATAFSQLTLEG
ncbi:MAG: tetraacyldisaccharide 4'-kinase [Bacteroidales bacterium]|jgi:tetraacyldisaccharide 4'-kinase|nr:tetraacyldisaccharide 4'-kinase [Bacteroidales bacterium]NLK80366.1 tetraacyldisaccharide 4'-kinase [Bacteroidales bacterium]